MNFDHLPTTLEPNNDCFSRLGAFNNSDFFSSNKTNSAAERDEEGPLKNIFSNRKLPALDSLSQQQQQQQQQDDYIRIKLSGMSVCVSPNSPREQSTLERDSANGYFPSTTAIKPFDPVRSSAPLRRIIEDNNGRRHSIANMDSNRPNHATLSSTSHHQYSYQPHYHHQASFFGHYSAPSSPPLQSTSRLISYTTGPPQSDYSIRRNSTALIYREKSIFETRRMSLNNQQYSRNSHMGKPVEEEHVKDEVEGLYSRSPELRISHKLAERKRRKEMKDLFEELKNALPVDKTLKTSKWEILSKAVEYVALLKDRDQNIERELISLRYQLKALKK